MSGKRKRRNRKKEGEDEVEEDERWIKSGTKIRKVRQNDNNMSKNTKEALKKWNKTIESRKEVKPKNTKQDQLKCFEKKTVG